MSLPKEPRQKMINMMYLVLTAMLALNVSSEILNAFKIVKDSLDRSSALAEDKSNGVMKSFQKLVEDPKTHDKASLWLPKAKKAEELTHAYVQALEDYQLMLKKESGFNPPKDTSFKKEDLDASTKMFCDAPPVGLGKGKELFKKMQDYKAALLAIDPNLSKDLGDAGIPIDLAIPQLENKELKNDKENAWSNAYFHKTPTIAALTILSKFENDARNTEAIVVEYFHKKVGEVVVEYDEFAALASGSSSYLMPGEELVITAGVGAFSKNSKPTISVDGASAQPQPDGTYIYKTVVNESGGPFTKKVHVSFVKPDGTQASVDKIITYTVGVPSGLTISTDKTRVFYQGLDNPLSVTGGGGAEKLVVTAEGEGVSSSQAGPGTYVVKCTELGYATITANDGKNPQIQVKIPVKRVPDPTIQVGGLKPGTQSASTFRVQEGLSAKLNDFVFEGITYTVTDFTLIANGKGFEEGFKSAPVSGSNYFNDDCKAILEKCQPGSTVTIDDITVVGPGGQRRKLDTNLSYILSE